MIFSTSLQVTPGLVDNDGAAVAASDITDEEVSSCNETDRTISWYVLVKKMADVESHVHLHCSARHIPAVIWCYGMDTDFSSSFIGKYQRC